MNPSLLLALLFFSVPLFAQGTNGARLFKSGPIQATADGRFVWAVNPDNDSVSRLETATDDLQEFKLPGAQKHQPKGLSLREDGSEIWVACHDSDRLFALNPAGEIIATVELPWGSGPYSVAIAPDQQKALVTLHRGEAAAVIDLNVRKVSALLDHLFWAPMGIAWTEGGKSAWINHIFAPGEHPLQTRIDFSGTDPVVAGSIQITPADPRQSANLTAPYKIAEGGYLNIRGHGAQIPSASGRNELWLPTQYHNFNTDTYTPDSTMQSAVRRIDLGTRALLNSNQDKVILSALHIHEAVNGGRYEGPGWNAQVAGPVDLAFTADGKTCYLLHELSRDLVILPTATPPIKPAGAAPLVEIAVGDRPIGLAVSPTAPVAYVYNLLSRNISKIDLVAKKELKRIPATPLTGEPFPESVLRGAKIFHTSDDPRISRNAKVACASCHINGEHDGRNWSFDRLPGMHGPRHTPTMLGFRASAGPKYAPTGWGQLHRSGDRDEVQDFEHTFQGPQMGGTGFLGTQVKPELGEPNAGLSADLDALASYLMFLDPLQRSPHRNAAGQLSEAAVRGSTFFTGTNRTLKRADASCAACHIPEKDFLDGKFHDVGQRRPATDTELGTRTPAWHVNTPTLVGVWATPPYGGMAQEGEAHSSEQAMISFLLDSAKRANNANHHGKPNGLTGRQLRDLAEFVLSINGNLASLDNVRDTVPPRMDRAEIISLTRIVVWFNETVKRAGVENVTNWILVDSTGAVIPVTSALWDSESGDRVDLTVLLRPHMSYTLRARAGITDDADSASNGQSNSLNPLALENTRRFNLTDRVTVTLGASSASAVVIPVHDTAMVSSGLNTWSHDSLWIAPSPVGTNPRSTTAFLRFGWKPAFEQITGVTNASALLHAAFSLQPELGVGQSMEARRVLQNWSDPATGNDWNSGATGAPTWRDSAHPTKRWNLAGAAKLGSNGTNTSDYNGLNDLAARADLIAPVTAINHRTEFAGALITDAFRFWFTNPSMDYGYAFRLNSPAAQGIKFSRHENGLRDEGPELKLTYLLPNAAPKLIATQTLTHVRLSWPSEFAGWQLEGASQPNGLWEIHSVSPTLAGPNLQIDVLIDSSKRFYRLSR